MQRKTNKVSLSQLFPKTHAQAMKSGEADFIAAQTLLKMNQPVFALNHIILAANKGHAVAQFSLAVHQIKGLEGVRPDILQGYKWLRKAAKGKIANAKYIVALLIVKAKEIQYHTESFRDGEEPPREEKKFTHLSRLPQTSVAEKALVNQL